MRPRGPLDPEFDVPTKGEEKGRPKRRWFVECLLAFVILCPFCFFLWWPILTSENFGKPLGQAIPTEPPDEANRVVHPQGFSIIVPPNWEPRISDDPPFVAIGAAPRMLLPSRWSAGLRVGRRPEKLPLDVADHRPTRFQGMPAFEHVTRQPGVFLDRPPRFFYTLVFQRDGVGYELGYHLADDRESLPPNMQQYFNTFRSKCGSGHGPLTTDN
jgi:hypothetical protein